jgi:uncharacterized protein YraI
MDYNCDVQKSIFLIAIFALFASACEQPASIDGATTPTPFIITATLPPGAPVSSTETPSPPALPATAIPVEGTTSTQLNVRADPSTAGAPLGIIGAFTQVPIIGKDPSGNWYKVLYPQGPDGMGWVTAQYVEVKDKDAIPVLGGAPGSGSGPGGVVTQQIYVRSGPGTDYSGIGTLNTNDVVTITGKDANSSWLQIEFPGGPDGKGWINAAFVQANGVDKLPILTGAGEVIGTGTPTSIPPAPTPTLIPAPQDGDSAQSPAINITFSPSGTRSLIYGSDVSAPDGDREDWVAFAPYGKSVLASLECKGNGALNVELFQNSQPVNTSIACGDRRKPLALTGGQYYLIHLQAPASTGGLQYTSFILTIETGP